jgi:hypothetical protein
LRSGSARAWEPPNTKIAAFTQTIMDITRDLTRPRGTTYREFWRSWMSMIYKMMLQISQMLAILPLLVA